jgi:uncharacterized membrane protein YuzA (DUF378 family)
VKAVRAVDGVALLLVVVGALNWGLVGLFKFDLVAWIFGGMDFGDTSNWSRAVYILVGAAGLYWLARVPAMFGARSSAMTGGVSEGRRPSYSR